MSFHSFNLTETLLDGLDSMGFETPTPIQEQVIPHALMGQDIIACAQTGTGKTAAYLLPVLDKIAASEIEHTSALIISPTRELALQIDQAFQGFSYFTHASSIAIYGGGDGVTFEREKKALTHGASVIIATPGRLLSHLNLGYVKFNQLDILVLDEADKMLDMGFYDDIMRINQYLPAKKQILLFSATMPPRMRELARRILHQPVEINIAISKPAEGILQEAFLVNPDAKNNLVEQIIRERKPKSVLIFASTKAAVKDLERKLRQLHLPARAIHSDLTQAERENVLLAFRTGTTSILVATDILSRGIDIENISLVINYDVPGDAEDYVHRVGRTARASTKGEAITLISAKDQQRFAQIERLIEREIPKITTPGAPAWNPLTKKKKSFSRKFNKKGRKPNSNSRKK